MCVWCRAIAISGGGGCGEWWVVGGVWGGTEQTTSTSDLIACHASEHKSAHNNFHTTNRIMKHHIYISKMSSSEVYNFCVCLLFIKSGLIFLYIDIKPTDLYFRISHILSISLGIINCKKNACFNMVVYK